MAGSTKKHDAPVDAPVDAPDDVEVAIAPCETDQGRPAFRATLPDGSVIVRATRALAEQDGARRARRMLGVPEPEDG